MNKWILYYCLLSKRFLKKAGFVLTLCAIPLLAMGLNLVSRQESGVLRIVLCAEKQNEDMAKETIERLSEYEGVLLFSVMTDAEEARDAVFTNQADAAWIFRENYEENMDAFARQGFLEEPAIRIIEREDTIALMLSRLRLFGAMYPELTYSAYRDFVKNEILEGEEYPEEVLRDVYEKTKVEGSLFRMAYRDAVGETEKGSYITAPLRGILTLMIMLCGFAAVMYYFHDEEQGMFEGTPARYVQGCIYVYVLAAMVPAGFVSVITLGIVGQLGKLPWEFLVMAAFLVSCCLVCVPLKHLFRSARVMGACIPFMLLSMFVLCPVFFSSRMFQGIQFFLPPYYYLNAVHNKLYFYRMLLYIVVCGLINLVLQKYICKVKIGCSILKKN